MAWDYDPSEASDCLTPGDYLAELESVEERVSKAGNPMLLVIWIIHHNGRAWKIYDYIVRPSGLFKLKNIARAWHLSKEFEARAFDLAEHLRRPITLALIVQSQEGYSDKNSVDGYKPPDVAPPPLFPQPKSAPGEEDIPF